MPYPAHDAGADGRHRWCHNRQREREPSHFQLVTVSEDDGKVAVDRTCRAEMAAVLAVPASHTYIMDDDDVISKSVPFL